VLALKKAHISLKSIRVHRKLRLFSMYDFSRRYHLNELYQSWKTNYPRGTFASHPIRRISDLGTWISHFNEKKKLTERCIAKYLKWNLMWGWPTFCRKSDHRSPTLSAVAYPQLLKHEPKKLKVLLLSPPTPILDNMAFHRIHGNP